MGRLVPRLAGVGERDQMTRQVAAVDRGDVVGVQHLSVDGAVPVVEVAAEALEPLHRIERRLEPLDGLDAAGPAEVARAHGREQVEPDVRRRRTVCDHGLRVVLDVVGR
jgi:hypothetical protein